MLASPVIGLHHPKIIGTCCTEVAFDQIRRRTGVWLTLVGVATLTPADTLDLSRTHQPRHPFTTHPHTFSGERNVDAECAIGAFGALTDLFDLLGQGFVFLRSPGRQPLQPRIVATGGDFQNSTQLGNRMLHLVRFHKVEDLSGIEPASRANQVKLRA